VRELSLGVGSERAHVGRVQYPPLQGPLARLNFLLSDTYPERRGRGGWVGATLTQFLHEESRPRSPYIERYVGSDLRGPFLVGSSSTDQFENPEGVTSNSTSTTDNSSSNSTRIIRITLDASVNAAGQISGSIDGKRGNLHPSQDGIPFS